MVGEMPHFPAAAVKLPVSTTRTNTSMARRTSIAKHNFKVTVQNASLFAPRVLDSSLTMLVTEVESLLGDPATNQTRRETNL